MTSDDRPTDAVPADAASQHWATPTPAEQPHAEAPSGRARPRRAARRLVTFALLAAALGGGAIGWQQREVAAGWQERAVALEQQRDDAIGRSEALSEQLGELANLVQLSVEDLATLEDRLAELAGEKAQAEDRATLTRDELRTLAERVDSAVRQLNACADDLFALQSATIDAYNSIARGTPVDVGPLNQRLTEMTERCSAARRAGESAVALASRLR
jgi:hypothetical protein